MNEPNTPTANKGGRPRKAGRVHKYIVPPSLEPIIDEYGIDYVWSAALQWYRMVSRI